MIKNWMLLSSLALTLAATTACGGAPEEAEAGDDVVEPAPAPAPAAEAPSLDCDGFKTKMTECLDPFAEAYSKTTFGSKAGKGTDGTVDHEAAAKRFKSLWGLTGEAMCGEYASKDAAWQERFAACDNTAACDAWVPCMSTALGESL